MTHSKGEPLELSTEAVKALIGDLALQNAALAARVRELSEALEIAHSGQSAKSGNDD